MTAELLEEIERYDSMEAEAARRDLRVFIRRFWHVIEPDRPLVWNWHHDVICLVLMAITNGELLRVIFNVPPGCSKSLFVSVFWPAWEWTRKPTLRYIVGTYGSHLSKRDNHRVRDIIRSPLYQKYYSVRIKEDQDEIMRYTTTRGGWRLATSIQGVGTGEHPDRFIIDDPTSSEDARSDVKREGANNWFDSTVSTRGIGIGVAIVLIQQRQHKRDMTGHLLSKGGWTLIRLPMRYETTIKIGDEVYEPDPNDPRSDPGELLFPQMYDEAKVRQMEIDLNAYGAAAQLQQHPAPAGGGLFKREWFEIVAVAPKSSRRVRSWDTAATEEVSARKKGKRDPDYTVGLLMSEVKGIYYIENVKRGRWSPSGVDAVIAQTARLDGRSVRVRELKEPGSSGVAVISARRKLLQGFDYGEIPIYVDKVTAAGPFRAQCEGGNVKLVQGAWNEEFLAELEFFPFGGHDDQVDGASSAFNELVTLKSGALTW
jgi:predicted phage terminase large subunit-like protein